MVLEPPEVFDDQSDALELAPESGESTSPAFGKAASNRQEFILLLHLTSLVREGLFDKLTAFV